MGELFGNKERSYLETVVRLHATVSRTVRETDLATLADFGVAFALNIGVHTLERRYCKTLILQGNNRAVLH